MTTYLGALGRPPVYISQSDRDRLFRLLDTVNTDSPTALALGEEVERATVVPDRSARRFVRLGSQVEIENLPSRRIRTVRLSMPGETNADAGDLSVLSPAGAALIGLREGETFGWNDAAGRRRTIRVLRIFDCGGGDGGPVAA